jgi:hypothetical protein
MGFQPVFTMNALLEKAFAKNEAAVSSLSIMFQNMNKCILVKQVCIFIFIKQSLC